ncbi:MAG: ATP synthase subunit I [Betaproteobacteria bacterium]
MTSEVIDATPRRPHDRIASGRSPDGGAARMNAYNPEALLHRPTTVMREPLGHDGPGRWDDEDDDRAAPLTREEAQALRAKNPSVSPWRVVATQCGVGIGVAALAWLASGSASVAGSALYGAAVAVLPGALMAHGTSRRPPGRPVGLGVVSLLSWSFVKIAASVAMLLLAPKIVQPLSWPALLVALVLCIQVYWLALLWRGR